MEAMISDVAGISMDNMTADLAISQVGDFGAPDYPPTFVYIPLKKPRPRPENGITILGWLDALEAGDEVPIKRSDIATLEWVYEDRLFITTNSHGEDVAYLLATN